MKHLLADLWLLVIVPATPWAVLALFLVKTGRKSWDTKQL